LGGEVGRHLVGIAVVVPLAVVVAGAGVLVEVAVGLAGGVVLARDVAVEARLVVLAGAQAVGGLAVDAPVVVVVEAVAPLVGLALAGAQDAEDRAVVHPDAAVEGRHRVTAAAAVARRRAALGAGPAPVGYRGVVLAGAVAAGGEGQSSGGAARADEKS